METISRKICFKQSVWGVAKLPVQILDRATWTCFSACKQIVKIASGKIESTIFTKRSYTWRDYIIPLSLLGSMFIPNDLFIYPWKYLISEFAISVSLIIILNKLKINTKMDDVSRRYLSALHPFHICLSGPVVEELVYRGFLQNGLSYFTRSPLLGLMGSSFFFGWSHFKSHYEGNYGHAITTGLGAITLGLVNQQYGIFQSIYSHCVWNSIASLSCLSSPEKPAQACPAQ
jgi:membrane protease YdiL (CAAX protease family)